MKYIMIEVTEPVLQLIPIIFPDILVHKMMARVVIGILHRNHDFSGCSVRSAGTINIATGHCYGGSEALGVTAHNDDARIIATYQYTHGIL